MHALVLEPREGVQRRWPEVEDDITTVPMYSLRLNLFVILVKFLVSIFMDHSMNLDTMIVQIHVKFSENSIYLE